jgi:hypothetical protein
MRCPFSRSDLESSTSIDASSKGKAVYTVLVPGQQRETKTKKKRKEKRALQGLHGDWKIANEIRTDQPLVYVFKACKGSHEVAFAHVEPHDPIRSEGMACGAGHEDDQMAQCHLRSAITNQFCWFSILPLASPYK